MKRDTRRTWRGTQGHGEGHNKDMERDTKRTQGHAEGHNEANERDTTRILDKPHHRCMIFILAPQKLNLDSQVSGRPLAVGKVEALWVDIHEISGNRTQSLQYRAS